MGLRNFFKNQLKSIPINDLPQCGIKYEYGGYSKVGDKTLIPYYGNDVIFKSFFLNESQLKYFRLSKKYGVNGHIPIVEKKNRKSKLRKL